MSEIAIMAIISIVGSLITAGVNAYQQNKEFGQQQLLQDDSQDFQREREDLLYERNSIPNQYQQMLDAGFNPILAANALMGGNNVTAAASGSAPSAPTTNSAIGALSQMLGQGNQNLYNLLRNNAEIQNIQSNTNKTDVEAGIMPRDYMLRMLSTTKQLEVWDASIKRTAAAQHLDEEQTKLLQQQNLYYGRMAEAEIKSYEAKAEEAFASAKLSLEQVNTEKSKQAELGTQSILNEANANLARAEGRYYDELQGETYYKKERERIALELEQKLGNIPLTADAQKYVHSLALNGDIEGLQNFYSNIFQTALNQQAGQDYGTHGRFGLPFNLWTARPNTFANGFGNAGMNAPIWNLVH